MGRRNRNNRPNAQPVRTGDSFQNLMTRTGIQGNNLSSGGQYDQDYISRNRMQLEAVYRTSWIAGASVDAYAEDMTREGIELKGDIDPSQIELIERIASRMGIWDAICDTVKWARLYGGCICVMMIDGQDASTPLRMDTIEKGQFKGLFPMDRWLVQPSLTNLITDLSPEMGMPVYYTTIADAQGLPNMKIHHSRVIRLDGQTLPYWQKITENGWGQSVLERIWDRLLAFDSTTQGAAQLIYKAHLRTYKVKGLRDIIGVGGKALEGLLKQIEMIRQYQSNEGMTLMDGEDEFEAHQYSFSGLDGMMLQFAEQLSGAVGIPLIRLFGQTPSGLNTTGEADLRNYYDNVRQQQERQLRTGVSKVYNALYRSVTGEAPPEGFDIEFTPLWVATDEQRATITSQITSAIVQASDAGIIGRDTALKELRAAAEVTGVFMSISDDEIKEAEAEPPPTMGEALNGESTEEAEHEEREAQPVN